MNDQDVFWVAGGSTANLLAVWRLHGLDSLLQTADERGAVLCDVSAGMNYWFEGSTTDSFGPALRALPDGLGFLSSSACPHYDTHATGRSSPACGLASAACRMAADDFAALHFGTASSSSPSTGATRLGVTASSPVLRSHCQLGSSDDTAASRRASSAPETCRKRTPLRASPRPLLPHRACGQRMSGHLVRPAEAAMAPCSVGPQVSDVRSSGRYRVKILQGR